MALEPGTIMYTPPRGTEFTKSTAVYFVEELRAQGKWIIAIPSEASDPNAISVPTHLGQTEFVDMFADPVPAGLLAAPARGTEQFEFEKREGDGVDLAEMTRRVPRDLAPAPAPSVSPATLDTMQRRIQELEAMAQERQEQARAAGILPARELPSRPVAAAGAPTGAGPLGVSGTDAPAGALNQILTALDGLGGRLAALERGGPTGHRTNGPRAAVQETGAFALPGASLSQQDAALVQELRRARPTTVGAAPARADAARLPTRRSSDPTGLEADPAGGDPVSPQLDSQFQQLAHALTTALRPQRSPHPFMFDEAKLYKLEGVRARMAQDLLEDQVIERPQAVIAEFETAVRREAPPDDPSEADISLGQLQRAFRKAAPAKEYPMFVRMIEVLLHIYHHLRNDRFDLAQARVALVLASLDQGLKDNAQMQKRADYIMCMPAPPVGLYHVHTQEEREALKSKEGKNLGAVTRFAGPTRGATARSLFFENAGA